MKLAKKPSATPKGTSNKAAASTPTNKKTPKKGKKGKLEEDGKDVLRIGSCVAEELDVNGVMTGLQAMRNILKKADGKKLFGDEGQKVHLQVTGIKLPKDERAHVLNIALPKPYLLDPHDVCLFVKDNEKGIRPDHEPTARDFDKMLTDKGVRDLVTEIIPLRQLKVEYKPFEAKAKLSNRFDKFLADDRIMRLLPKFLGKHFYKKKRFPTQVNLKAKDLKSELAKALRTTQLPLSHHGACAQVNVGHSGMSDEDLASNIVAVSKILAKRYPGGWRNIRAIHVKTETSMALPLHVSTVSANEIGFVDADIPAKVKRQAVSGELSTQPGMEVTVLPSGVVKIKKSKDPEWDDEKDEPFVEGSEEENEEEEEEKEEEKPARAAKKRKDTSKDVGAKKKKSKVSGDDSEDEEIEREELRYLGKAKSKNHGENEENENEGEGEESDEDKKEEPDDDDGDNAEESSDDGGESKEEVEEDGSGEESEYDDDDELGQEDIVVDSDDDDDEEEEDDDEGSEEEDEDEKLLLKRKQEEDDESE